MHHCWSFLFKPHHTNLSYIIIIAERPVYCSTTNLFLFSIQLPLFFSPLNQLVCWPWLTLLWFIIFVLCSEYFGPLKSTKKLVGILQLEEYLPIFLCFIEIGRNWKYRTSNLPSLLKLNLEPIVNLKNQTQS